MDIFGYKITRNVQSPTEKSMVAPSVNSEGAIDTFTNPAVTSGHFGTYMDLEGGAKSEIDLIQKYRNLSLQADVNMAIEDIVNAGIANLEGEIAVTINLDEVEFSPEIKKKIEKEFDVLLRRLDFKNKASEYFRRWYIDGRLYFHKVIDTAKPELGITDIRYIDPRKIQNYHVMF